MFCLQVEMFSAEQQIFRRHQATRHGIRLTELYNDHIRRVE